MRGRELAMTAIAILGVALLAATSAAADPAEPSVEAIAGAETPGGSGSGEERAATAWRALQAQSAVPQEPSGAASATGGGTHHAISFNPWWTSPHYLDPTGDAPTDLIDYQLWYEVGQPQGVFLGVDFRVAWGHEDVSEVALLLDVDRRLSTGCNGFDYIIALALTDEWYSGFQVLEYVDCDTLVTPGGYNLGGGIANYNGDENRGYLGVVAHAFGGPVSFDWALVLAGRDGDPVDVTPVHDGFGWTRPFSDVPVSVPFDSGAAFYTGPTAWLRQTGLSTGVGSTGAFHPDALVTRGEMATFIHRIDGSPAAPPNPFDDVPREAFYTAAVDHLYAAGLTTGVAGTNQFRPGGTLTRGEMVTFLWRYYQMPTGSPPSPFVDVSAGAFYGEAVAWAFDVGLTTGVGGSNRFEPGAPLTRGQLATFLQRAFMPLD